MKAMLAAIIVAFLFSVSKAWPQTFRAQDPRDGIGVYLREERGPLDSAFQQIVVTAQITRTDSDPIEAPCTRRGLVERDTVLMALDCLNFQLLTERTFFPTPSTRYELRFKDEFFRLMRRTNENAGFRISERVVGALIPLLGQLPQEISGILFRIGSDMLLHVTPKLQNGSFGNTRTLSLIHEPGNLDSGFLSARTLEARIKLALADRQ